MKIAIVGTSKSKPVNKVNAMNLKELIKRMSEPEHVTDMSTVNMKEQKLFPSGAYKLQIHSGDHEPPHFHVVSTGEEFDIKLLIETGELYQIKRFGKRKRTDNFSDIVILAKKWLDEKPAHPKAALFETNRDNLEYVWEMEHQDD